MSRSAVWLLASVALATTFVGAPFADCAIAPPARPSVTVIADSVLTAVAWNEAPLAALGDGFDLRLDAGVCRTLTGISCPFEGERVPTLVDLVAELGPSISPTVVVEVGYSDPAATFADSVERSVDALLAARVETIVWVNLHEAQPQYVGMNEALLAAARRHPEIWLVDWNAYSRDRWSWFQGDGVHLAYDGAMAMARLLHDSVLNALAPRPSVTTGSMAAATVGTRWATRLEADGGVTPYAWQIVSGPLPRGLRLLRDGTIFGTPRVAGRFALTFRLTDARGRTATRTLVLTIGRSAA